MKKYICALAAMLLLTVSAAAAELFPVSVTQLDGETHWGYLDDNGATQVSAFYAEADEFNDYGFAVVKNVQGKTGVIDTDGDLVVACRETPLSVEFSDEMEVFRYADKSIYFDRDGNEVGEYTGAAGFFSKEGLLRVEKSGKWGYVKADGSTAIAPIYLQASDFSGGYALVQQLDGSYGFLTADGIFTALPAQPDTFSVKTGKVAILRSDAGMQLYSLQQGKYLTGVYDSISAVRDGFAIVQQGELYGIIDTQGKERIKPQYYYLYDMGQGIYATRDANGISMAIDCNGAHVYTAGAYASGFDPFQFGMSWCSTDSGGIVFFSNTGSVCGKVAAADTAEIVGDGVAKITLGDTIQYIRVADGKTLYVPTRTYHLDGGLTISTSHYEKYLGGSISTLQAGDDSEYGWDLEYPVVSGMSDKAVQETINNAIEGFFMNGPSATAQRQPLVGDYGVTVCGQVLVVYANAVAGQGIGAMPWNGCILLDLTSGASYSVPADLLKGDYVKVLKKVLPTKNAFYLYGAPRITPNGILYHVAHAQTATQDAYTDSYVVYFSELADVLNTDGALWKAMHATGDASGAPVTTFKDVASSDWAYTYVQKVSQNGWMLGSGDHFYPARSIAVSQAAAALARALHLSDGRMDGIDQSAWYAGPYGGVYEAGLLAGLEDADPLAPLSRVQAMQLFANVLHQQDDEAALTDAQVQTLLSGYSDTAKLTETQRVAVAYCIQQGLISGTDGRLNPQGSLTRAQFAKLLCAVI